MQPNTEMSYCHVGFDLKAAREICIKLDLRYPARSLVDIDYQCALAAEMLPAALDEIERQANRIAELEADLEYYKSGFHSERGVHERVAAILGTDDAPWMLAQRAIERIAKLEILLGVARKDEEWVANKFGAKIDKQRAALKKLGQAKRERGKALVEERARRICHVPGDPVGHWARYEKVVVDEAREQLVHEGKL